jgi:hypothetical protein
MRVVRVFWRNDPKQKLRAQVEYWAHSLGSTGFGPTPAAAIKSQRHSYRRKHSYAPCCRIMRAG